jgi:PIN domain nuclease of toxin-antitoxin system
MRILLDTHSLLWFLTDSPKLSSSLKVMLEPEDIFPLVSMASLWEIAIKITLHKLDLPVPFDVLIDKELPIIKVDTLSIELKHMKVITQLPMHHRDPFDRLIIAQALAEDIPVISADSAFDAYGVKRLW